MNRDEQQPTKYDEIRALYAAHSVFMTRDPREAVPRIIAHCLARLGWPSDGGENYKVHYPADQRGIEFPIDVLRVAGEARVRIDVRCFQSNGLLTFLCHDTQIAIDGADAIEKVTDLIFAAIKAEIRRHHG